MAKEESGGTELKRLEFRERGRRRDFFLEYFEVAEVTGDILVELVAILAKRTLGLVSPLLLIGFMLLGIAGFIGWILFLLTHLFHHF